MDPSWQGMLQKWAVKTKAKNGGSSSSNSSSCNNSNNSEFT